MLSQAIVEFGSPLKEIETPTPAPQGTEILLKTAHAGVCHSDVHIHDGYFDLGGGNKLPMGGLKLPHTLGHEIEGEVVAVGPDVKGVKVGDHYAAYPWIGCGDCAACKRNEENLCLKPRQLGCSAGVPGGYATHVMVPHPKYLLDYGKTNPALAAAYMCSGLTAFGAMKKVGKLAEGDEVVVLGCGGVGMMGIQFAKALFGKGPIAADIDDGRLEAAKKAGAKATYNSKDPANAKKLMADTGGAYAVVDFVGSEFVSFRLRQFHTVQQRRQDHRRRPLRRRDGHAAADVPLTRAFHRGFVRGIAPRSAGDDGNRARRKSRPDPLHDASARTSRTDAVRPAQRQDHGTRGSDAVIFLSHEHFPMHFVRGRNTTRLGSVRASSRSRPPVRASRRSSDR